MVWNDGISKFYQSNNWRTSLVPAPAVIPAPIVYFKVVAVKTLVVDVCIQNRRSLFHYHLFFFNSWMDDQMRWSRFWAFMLIYWHGS